MGLVRNCCGFWDLKGGARNIAIISMVYDLMMAATLLLVYLLLLPLLPFQIPDEKIKDASMNKSILVYQVLLIISICIRAIHLIPSFLLLYSTWEEIPHGVGCWIFVGGLDAILHMSWLPIPFFMKWSLETLVIFVSFDVLAILIIIYFLMCISSFRVWIIERHQDLRAKRRLKDDY